MSTATPLSERLPAALTDLSELYLLAVLETDEGDGYSVTVRSLRDRTVTCRCPILIGSSGSSIAAGDEEAASVAMQGMKVYVSPGYGGGVFVVANEGAPEECAKVWRGTFDEGEGGRARCVFRRSRRVRTAVLPWHLNCVIVRFTDGHIP